jgi:hypothetical protein
MRGQDHLLTHTYAACACGWENEMCVDALRAMSLTSRVHAHVLS